jgi:DNA-binding Xre family transcriptional regulator
VKRSIGYRWLLRDVMADHGLFATTALVPLLAERGIELSPSQVHRLVTQTPERLSMPILVALCDIFECLPNDLVAIDVTVVADKKAVNGTPITELPKGGRPRRARVAPDA